MLERKISIYLKQGMFKFQIHLAVGVSRNLAFPPSFRKMTFMHIRFLTCDIFEIIFIYKYTI